MHTLSAKLTFHIPHATSLKDKRQIRRSIIDKARHRFNASIAEISDMEAQLGDGFVRCHRSYIVGLRHVNRITKTDVVLDGGEAIPLSRRMYNEVNQAFIAYHMR